MQAPDDLLDAVANGTPPVFRALFMDSAGVAAVREERVFRLSMNLTRGAGRHRAHAAGSHIDADNKVLPYIDHRVPERFQIIKT